MRNSQMPIKNLVLTLGREESRLSHAAVFHFVDGGRSLALIVKKGNSSKLGARLLEVKVDGRFIGFAFQK